MHHLLLQSCTCRWKGGIKRDEVGHENVDWFHLVLDRDQQRAFVNTENDLSDFIKAGNFFTSFLSRALLYGVASIGPPQSSHTTKDNAPLVCPICSYFFCGILSFSEVHERGTPSWLLLCSEWWPMLFLSDNAERTRALLEVCQFYFTCIFINIPMRFEETPECLVVFLIHGW